MKTIKWTSVCVLTQSDILLIKLKTPIFKLLIRVYCILTLKTMKARKEGKKGANKPASIQEHTPIQEHAFSFCVKMILDVEIEN